MNTASHGRLIRRSRAGRSAGPFFAFIVGMGGILGAVGCQKMPERPPDALTLYALDPYSKFSGKPPTAELFHDYDILGASEIKERDRRAELMWALQRSIDESTGDRAECFNPRHGLRVTNRGVIREYVICFECASMVMYREGGVGSATISDYGAPIFNRFLKEEGLPVPK